MKTLLGIKLNDKEFDRLICEQNKGKQLKVEDGKVVAFDYVPTQEELNELNLLELKTWFNNEYRYKTEKYTRLIVLNKLDDDGENPQDKLNALYLEAEENRLKIQELGG